MAFPLSHPAAVLPLTLLPKRYFSSTGLIIGSLVPDFEYLLRMDTKAIYANQWPSLLWFNPLMGLLLAFIFHHLIRKPLILNLPYPLRKRFIRFSNFSWMGYFRNHWGVVIISLLIGTASHLAWDSLDLSHSNGHVFRSLYAWTSGFVPEGLQIPFIRIIQHLPSIAGLLLIVLYIWKMPASSLPEAKIRPYWVFIFFGGIAFAFLMAALRTVGPGLLPAGLAFGNGILLAMCLFPFYGKLRNT